MPFSAWDRHLFGDYPKRTLAFVGGGVRGVISLAYLERLEVLLSARLNPNLVLADYFALIGGTLTDANCRYRSNRQVCPMVPQRSSRRPQHLLPAEPSHLPIGPCKL